MVQVLTGIGVNIWTSLLVVGAGEIVGARVEVTIFGAGVITCPSSELGPPAWPDIQTQVEVCPVYTWVRHARDKQWRTIEPLKNKRSTSFSDRHISRCYVESYA
jgi:hypothetical protein